MSEHKTDISVIQDILKGNAHAFEQLYKRYARFYLLTCLRYMKTRSDAEDMLQEACIKIYKDLYQFNAEKASFISWSKRIVINTCLMELRRNSVVDYKENVFEIGTNFSVNSNALENLKLEDLTKIVQTLPRGYRTVFNMYVVDGYAHNEIADMLNISVSTSKTQLMKARKLLQNKIAEKETSLIENYAG